MIPTPRGRLGIVTVNARSPIPKAIVAPVAMDYGAETHEQRIARREQRWSPVSGAGI
jgi:hypothetical protein